MSGRRSPHVYAPAWAGRLVDLLGPAAFPAVYLPTGDFIAATVATIVAAAVALAARAALDGRLAPLSLLSGTIAAVTGLLASVLGSKAVIEAEPTVMHLAVGVALLVAWFLDGRPVRAVFGRMVALPDRTWATLSLRFALFALAMAIANEVVRRTAPMSVWALFHFPGQLLLHVGFALTQVPLILGARRTCARSGAKHA